MGIFIYYLLKGGLVDAQFLPADTVLLQLLRYKVPLGNLHLLLGKVSRDIDHLHPVEQGRLHGGNGVRRGDEKDVGQIVVYVQVIVMEGYILLRVKYFQEC